MPGRDVVLWLIDDELLNGDERRGSARSTERVTDVFYRAMRPKPGSLLLGVRALPGDVGGFAVALLGMASGSQQVATGKDRTLVTPLLRLQPPVAVARLHEVMPEPQRRRLEQQPRVPGPLRPARLSPKVGDAMIAALRQLSPPAAQWLAALSAADTPVGGGQGARLREERDAVSLAIDMSGVDPPPDLLYTPGAALDPEAPFGGTFNPLFVTDNEDDLLAVDLRRFDPRSRLAELSGSITRFTSGRFALTVMNVNRKALEHTLGVDLVYWDETANTFTMVQYKRLSVRTGRDHDGDRWAYTNRDELAAQLHRMDLGQHVPADSRDWRLTSSPFWFKFVKTTDFTARDRFVLKGMYVPADYLRLAIADESLRTGARGGFEVTYANTRYLTRDVFVELVKRGFAGTTRSASEHVITLAAQRAQTNEVIVAIKAPEPQYEPWPYDDRDDDVSAFSP
ncbi:hypothetical protein AB0M46_41210 [Dactylosporangium sp. NPDC051485]|uniref:hypothetical protein n=1 Tax=Dactylosporangium sp. NPDC051485 TaxID=3154846 RepID=UPI0034434E70